MRAHGELIEVPGAGATDHICWVYDQDDATFDRAVRRFLAGGLARGDRLLCIGERVLACLAVEDDDFAGADALLGSGALRTMTTRQAYEATGVFAAGTQLAYYRAATEAALADGFTGLRVVADVSPLAADPGVREELVRWEHVADSFAASGAGFTAMCAYSAELTAEALTEVASVHPLAHVSAEPTFRVFFDDDRVALSGSVDTFSADRLARVLESSPVSGDGAVLDLARVEFVDVAASRVIARWARDLDARSLPLEVQGASPVLRRMWRVLGLADVAGVRFAA